MRQSNTYTLIFTAIITIILGFVLSLVSESLRERQEINVAIDAKKNILKSLDFVETEEEPWTNERIQFLFDEYIVSFVIDAFGNRVEGMEIVELDPKIHTDLYPIYSRIGLGNIIEGYSIPISGKGLWSTLYGYFALEADGFTVKGIKFYKHGETPGLGGEVDKDWFTSNFIGKRIIDDSGKLVSIQIVRGEVDETASGAYRQVDGISGATMTTKGLNGFLMSDLQKYNPFFNRIRTGSDS